MKNVPTSILHLLLSVDSPDSFRFFKPWFLPTAQLFKEELLSDGIHVDDCGENSLRVRQRQGILGVSVSTNLSPHKLIKLLVSQVARKQQVCLEIGFMVAVDKLHGLESILLLLPILKILN